MTAFQTIWGTLASPMNCLSRFSYKSDTWLVMSWKVLIMVVFNVHRVYKNRSQVRHSKAGCLPIQGFNNNFTFKLEQL